MDGGQDVAAESTSADDELAPTVAPRRNAPAVAVIALLAGVSVALWPQVAARPVPDAPFSLPWWLLLAMFAVAETFVLHVQVRREAKTISLSEIPLILGLAYVATPVLLLTRLVGSVAVFVLHRRQRNPVKLAFNATLVVTDLFVAIVVFQALGGDDPRTGVSAWVATYLAVAAMGAVDAIALGLAIGLYEGAFKVREVVHEAWTAAAMSMGVGTLALVGVSSLEQDAQTAWLLGASALVLVFAYRAYATLNERHRSLEQLYQFSQVVGSVAEVDDVLRIVLAQARDLLRSESAEVTFMVPSESTRHVRASLGPDGRLQRAEVPAEEVGALFATALEEGVPVLARRGTRDSTVRLDLLRRQQREAIVVPLRRDGAIVGTVAVANRTGDVRTFDRADVRLLETVANHAAVALQNGRLIGQLRHEALHDSLTGLPNRAFLMHRMREALARLDAGQVKGVAALLMDLDGFKEVNDTLGHQQGDQLLIEVGARLQVAAGAGATVARLGGDEFAVLLPDLDDPETAARVGHQLVAALHEPFRLSDLKVEVSGSVGLALAPEHAGDVSSLLKRADVAMYEAKATNIDLCTYDADLDRHSPERLALLAELREALQLGHVVVHVQPKVDLRDGSVHGVEALARWQHAEYGAVPPSVFVPIAERSGLIRPLTAAVLGAALEGCQRWMAEGHEVGVAVNLSPRSLLHPDLVDDVRDALHRYGVRPELLTLEITESSVMTDPDLTIAVLGQLRAMGVRLSIDDFGTGYSSLSYLQRLPVHEVKIDRSFVADMCHDADGATIVRSIIDLGTNLALHVVAEGVEDRATWDRLGQMGCRSAQGYLVSRPIPVDDLVGWLAARDEEVITLDQPDVVITLG